MYTYIGTSYNYLLGIFSETQQVPTHAIKTNESNKKHHDTQLLYT